MNFLATLYAIAALSSIAACTPQIIQILKTKNVEGISLQTYDLWFILQLTAIPYVVQSGNVLWATASILWAVYYAVMIVLIQYYRYPHYIRSTVGRLVAILRFVPIHVK